MAAPRIISVDDHVIEPPQLWEQRLPSRLRDRGPHVVRDSYTVEWIEGNQVFRRGGSGPETDFWEYEDLTWCHQMLNACAGYRPEQWWMGPIGFDQMRPGCFEPKARLADMDRNGVEASLCFPTFPRFCGQMFAERTDRDLALACIRAYNDWMVEEWAGQSGGRLIPLCIVPLWDPNLAAAEVRRNAARGVPAVAFTELPTRLGLPSIHQPDRPWDTLFAACHDTSTVLCMHIGSGSWFPTTSPDAPAAVTATLVFLPSAMALADWLFSGVLERFDNLRISLSEGQLGWIPYVLERADTLWRKGDVWNPTSGRLPRAPSSYMSQIFGCFYDDQFGIRARDVIGVDQITFETDYPHMDSTWPDTAQTLEPLRAQLSADELDKVLWRNAARMLHLPATAPAPGG
jgi:predicted TIM-barrel fold metal-dependent hydrolase